MQCSASPRLCGAGRADATEEWRGVCSLPPGSVALVARTQPRNGVEGGYLSRSFQSLFYPGVERDWLMLDYSSWRKLA